MTANTRPLCCVRLTSKKPGEGVSYVSHRDRTSWSRRQAQRHAKAIREGRTGIDASKLAGVDVVEA